MASGDLLHTFTARDNEPPLTIFATYNTRNNHLVLEFDAATDEEAVFSDVLARHYAGGGITARVCYMMTSAVANSVRIQAAFERHQDVTDDLDADSFAAFQSAGEVVPGTSGQVGYLDIVFTNGANMDNLAAGEHFRFKVRRDADGTSGTDDATGDMQLLSVELRETQLARDFSGTSQYIEAATVALAGGATLMAHVDADTWSYPANSGVLGGILVKGQFGSDADGDLRLIALGGKARFDANTSGGLGAAESPSLAINVPYLLVGVHDEAADQVRLYIDSILVAQVARTGTLSNNARTLAIGTYVNALTTTEFNGRIAECAMWSRALTAPEIIALGTGPRPRSPLFMPDALVFYMPLRGLASPEPELMRSNNGTLTGPPVAAAHPQLWLPSGSRRQGRRTLAAGVALGPWVNYREYRREFDQARYNGTMQHYFEAHLETGNATFPAYARLYNETDGEPVQGSQVSTAALTTTRVRSGPLTFKTGPKIVIAQFSGQAGGSTYTMHGWSLLPRRIQ